ncbi:MAG: hypothetical protein IRZ18_09285, partial [Clostridia bacterium]|nr:hypothetical protein [Clostridia bacterium]
MSGDKRRNAYGNPWRTGLSLGVLGFVIAVGVGLPSEELVARIPPGLAVPLVLFIIVVAVLLDMLGVAVTAADPVPFHAKASKREPGARQGLYLIQRADRVASIAMDITGDVTAAVAGAATVAIIAELAKGLHVPHTVLNALGIGIITFLFIGGKAFVKGYSIRNANAIVMIAGLVLHGIEQVTRIQFAKPSRRRNGRSRGTTRARVRPR